jgi:hypothetical protein
MKKYKTLKTGFSIGLTIGKMFVMEKNTEHAKTNKNMKDNLQPITACSNT